MGFSRSFFAVLLLLTLLTRTARGDQEVTYDGRSLFINGKRDIFFSGSIHYPRSTAEMWPDLIKSAKDGGLNVIETYTFWNAHEPVHGQYNFEGNCDLVKFIKLVQAAGMYVVLRLGPFVQGEWNHGGLPYWLREVPDITFRTDNEAFKNHMEKFVKMIVQKLQDEKLFAPQGGPIILAQIENEYNNIARALPGSAEYIKWAANMALGLNVGVPWVMCKQNDAPGPVINACNGRNCGDTFMGPNHPTKPSLWTENWTAQYRVFGDPPSQRSAEDLSYSVARFFSKNGTLVNYYMYHGGTNFGRTGASFVMTRYYDEAPLDEYGLPKEPKKGHLRDLHAALKLSRKGLLWGSYSLQKFGAGLEARIYEIPENKICVAFLTNTHTKIDGKINFRGTEFALPRHSISILPDCKTVVYNTQQVNAQHNSRTFDPSKDANANNNWEMYQDVVPTSKGVKSNGLMELYNMTKDTTDYLWYATSFKLNDDDLPFRHDIHPVIQVSSLGHIMHTFVNGEYIGSAHGTKIEKSFVFQKPADLKTGGNRIAILGGTVGMPDSGAYLEHRVSGVHSVVIQGLNAGTLDLSQAVWKHQVGLTGEALGIFQEENLNKVQWVQAKSGTPITWYKRYFDSPSGTDPVSLDLSSMGKGMVWVNGQGVGRYWVNYLSPLGKPSQHMYHVPRSFLKPKSNLMVVLEEQGGNPEDIKVMIVKRDNICTVVSKNYTAPIDSWSREDNKLKSAANSDKPEGNLQCGEKKVIRSIVFASYGNPDGACGNFTVGNCHSPNVKKVVEQTCLGKPSCALPVSAEAYGVDAACPGSTNTLIVQAKCAKKSKA
ncbi:beta-galactosidase 11-like [Zingiber officinale]|uniref:beta-galactosidase 11-like n=1 Tax=Zingiber officinale TaxID=94328 RepID=UPI001C4C3E55|nr:beta-galactosidase 11-like [Zingiber officinale]